MMKEQVIIQAISITRRSQQNFFQVKLPRDTGKIIGIESGLIIQDSPPYAFSTLLANTGITERNNLMGVMQLKANGRPDIFYANEIFERDLNIGAGELRVFSNDQPNERRLLLLRPRIPPDGNSFGFSPSCTHGTKREEDPLNICGCTVINGYFKDSIGDIMGYDLSYKVMLYIWIERQLTSNDNKPGT